MNDKQYEVVAARRLAADGLVWQAPSLAIAAQSFLLSAAHNPDADTHSAFLLSILSILVGLASYQLMQKHRQLEVEDAQRLKKFEAQRIGEGFSVVHGKIDGVDGAPPRSWLVKLSSFNVWSWILVLFIGFGFYSAWLSSGAEAVDPMPSQNDSEMLSEFEARLGQVYRDKPAKYSRAYAIVKDGLGGEAWLATIHGYPDNRLICAEIVKPYNSDSSLSVFPGSYRCVALAKSN